MIDIERSPDQQKLVEAFFPHRPSKPDPAIATRPPQNRGEQLASMFE
jgi:hypothetical protein